MTELNVRALRSGVHPRTEDRGWVGSPKSVVGWMEPRVILPFSSHQVYKPIQSHFLSELVTRDS